MAVSSEARLAAPSALTAPIRPKVGRAPASVLTLPAPPAPREEEGRWDARFVVSSLALILALALLAGWWLRAAQQNLASDPAIPPLLPVAQEPGMPVQVQTPHSELVGTVTKMNDRQALSDAHAPQAKTQTPVDKDDKKRLLSILSNN